MKENEILWIFVLHVVLKKKKSQFCIFPFALLHRHKYSNHIKTQRLQCIWTYF